MGLGKWIKRATTMPKGSFGEKIFGRSILDEAGTVGGFALGGPQGAALGRGLGKYAATGDVSKGVGGAVEGYALGTGAKALGVPGGGGTLKLPGIPGMGGGGAPSAGTPGGVPGAAGAGRPGLGSAILRNIGRGAEWATANPQRTALVTGALQTGLGAYGASQADAAANRQADFAEQRATRMDPQREALMDIFMQRLRGQQPPAGG